MTARQKIAIDVNDRLASQLRGFAADYAECCILDSNDKGAFTVPGGIDYQCIIAFDAIKIFTSAADPGVFDRLLEFHQTHTDFLFGHFNYDVKNALEKLSSDNPEYISFPDVHFFVPRYLFIQQNDKWFALLREAEAKNVTAFLQKVDAFERERVQNNPVKPLPLLSREAYIEKVSGIKHHIQQGDIYEANFCQNFVATSTLANPHGLYCDLRALAPTPYGAFYRVNSNYLMCASPEQYVKKEGKKIISRPIKGTAKRGENPQEDALLKQRLYHDKKERGENVMIVDLVRNDLSRCAATASVNVEELFGIYEFPGVHQMISTVTCELRPDLPFTKVIEYSFPPGSMTGAPKIRAMEIIEKFEVFKRNIYSGSVGYITPEADFDFNVVIRSVFYDAASEYISFAVGGAITDLCNAQSEYDESLLKARNMFDALSGCKEHKDLFD